VKIRTAWRIFFRKPEGKRPVRKYRCGWEGTILKLMLKKYGM
jgi:hypothetical protein